MHASSYENMQYCYDTYVRGSFLDTRSSVTTVDLGAANVNGTYRPIFSHPKVQYVGVDLAPGSGVDLVLNDPYRLPMTDASVDIVLSGQTLEHCEYFWLAFQEMVRILKPDGLLFLIAPSTGGIHRYPVDCYRFYPDAYRALAKYTNCELLAVWRDDREPWRDLVGVFSGRGGEGASEDTLRGSADRSELGRNDHLVGSLARSNFKLSAPPEAEAIAGTKNYLDVLRNVHAVLQPRRYLEIGVRHGDSLVLARNEAIGVDPAPDLIMRLRSRATLFRETSDRFFREHAQTTLASGVDLGFIDGMHLFEYALRDFMNLEGYSHPASLIIFDDILPNHPLQAARQCQTRIWTGDVWKIVPCLRKYRPDLLLLRLASGPTGLLLVVGLDSDNRVLWESYDQIVAEFTRDHSGEVQQQVIERAGVLDPEDPRLAFLLHELHELRCGGASRSAVCQRLHQWCVALFPPLAPEDQRTGGELVRAGQTGQQCQMAAIHPNDSDGDGQLTQQQVLATQCAYMSYTSSFSWAVSSRLRRFRAWVMPYGTRRWRLHQLAVRGWRMWKSEGAQQALLHAWSKIVNCFRPASTSTPV